MDFYAVLDQAVDLLRQRGRVTYRALKLQFQLDDDQIEALKDELLYAYPQVVDDAGRGLRWSGAPEVGPPPAAVPSPAQDRAPLSYTPPHLAEQILTSRAALEGERKRVTVLFADLKGSMELLAERDPEEARQLLDPVLNRMMAAVHQYEGTVNQVMGDGIMALFGAPLAEDHALRACYAALRMQAAVQQYATEVQHRHGVPLHIRVGLNAGEVVVRSIGSDLRMDYTAVGQTTHLAARMEQMAMPGSILITPAVLGLVEGFVQVKALGAVPVKGLREPLEVYEVTGAGIVRSRAVIGPEVPLPLLQAIAERPEADLHRGLAHLQAAEFLYETRLFPEREFTFKHALTHEVAYSGLLQERRRALHARIVEALEALVPERLAEHVDRLAYHAMRGEVWDKALAYSRQAGVKAMARSAYHEAAASFEQALAALAQLPECCETLEQAIDLRFDLRNALQPLGEHARIFDCLHAAEALAERLDDPQRLGRLACYLCFSITGEHDRAMASGQRALVLAATSSAFDVQVIAQTFLGVAHYAMGDYWQGLDCARQVIALLPGALYSARFGLPVLPAVLARGYVAWGLAELGDFVEATSMGEDAVQLGEAAAQPTSTANALWCVGLVHRRQGDVLTAIPILEQALALSQTVNILLIPTCASLLGVAYALAGRTAEALPLLEPILERVTTGLPMFFHKLVFTELSEALLLVGRLDEASMIASRLFDLSRTHPGHGYQAHAYRLLGEVARRREPPDVDQAAAHYRQALALAEELGMRPLQAHCHLGLGTLYARTGQRQQAQTALSAAIDLYRAMDMTFWLPRAEAALA